jgi:hypothetical protein
MRLNGQRPVDGPAKLGWPIFQIIDLSSLFYLLYEMI